MNADRIKQMTEAVICQALVAVLELTYVYLWYLRFTTGAGFMDTVSQLRLGVSDIFVILGLFIMQFWATIVHGN